jgi:HK97 family phage portal protein
MTVTQSAELEKAQVSLPPPGGTSRWALIGGNNTINDLPMPDKRQQAAIYYEMYRQHPVVRAAIDKKAQYASAGGYRFKPIAPGVSVHDRKIEILERFFRRSNAQKLIRLTYKDLDIYGESFWLVIRSSAAARTPMKVVRLNPRYMTPIVRNGWVVRWKYGPVSGAKNAVEYDDEIILHFSLEDPESDVQGISPLHPLQRAVAQDIFAMEYNESFFKNSAQTGTIFIVKSANEGQAERNRKWIEDNYTGPQNAHRPLLIEGDVDVEKSVSTPVEMEFLEGRMLLRQEIAMCLEVDLDKLGVHEGSNRSVSRTVDDSFQSESVWPRQVILEEEINNKLILEVFGWNDVIFDHNDRDPRRTQDQADVDDKNLKSGREDINTQRNRLGLPPVEGGDEAFVMTPTGIIFVRNFPALADQQATSGLPVQSDGGVGSTGQAPPKAAVNPPLTKRKATDVSQNE